MSFRRRHKRLNSGSAASSGGAARGRRGEIEGSIIVPGIQARIEASRLIRSDDDPEPDEPKGTAIAAGHALDHGHDDAPQAGIGDSTGQQPAEPPAVHVLLVDDNERYREAFSRVLMLEGFDVKGAADGHEAIEAITADTFDVVITDLAMRTETEGLDVIRAIKGQAPLLPVIMISAVGTFEEGAEAKALGASAVISKMRIDQEITRLVELLERLSREHREHRDVLERLERMRRALESESPGPEGLPTDEALPTLQQWLARPDLPTILKSEVFDVLQLVQAAKLRQEATRSLEQALGSGMRSLTMEQIDDILDGEITGFGELDEETLQSLRTAEYLYNMGGGPRTIDFSRNIGFSYCFAVENQVKSRMRRRLQRFFGSTDVMRLLPQMLERDHRHISLYFHQHLLHILRGRDMDVTFDNIRQTLVRMLEHGGRYKPDGLKAMGIVLICFARTYSFQAGSSIVTVHNPLGLRGLDDDHQVVDLAELLVALQHFRNPYIHPEISELEKISKIRRTSFDCLNFVQRIQT